MALPVETASDHADPALRTRYYALPYADVWRAAKEAFRDVARMRLVQEDALAGTLDGERPSAFLRLKERVRLTVQESETGDVEVRGEADKAATLRELLLALDARLTRAP